jgi:hypothetical protein
VFSSHHPIVVGGVQSRVYVLGLLAVSIVIFVLLLQVNPLLGVFFLILAVTFIPALVLQRREAASGPEIGPDAESTARGWLRLAGTVGLDTTGLALGILLLLLIVVGAYWWGHQGLHHH